MDDTEKKFIELLRTFTADYPKLKEQNKKDSLHFSVFNQDEGIVKVTSNHNNFSMEIDFKEKDKQYGNGMNMVRILRAIDLHIEPFMIKPNTLD